MDERNDMACPGEDELERLAGGGGGVAAAEGPVSEHVKQCSRCTGRLEEVRANLAAMSSISGALGGQRLFPGLGAGARIIDGYRVIREIGRGGSAIVYEAEQLAPGRRVALKVLRLGATPGEARLIRREAEALARLSHPGIAAVHSTGLTRDGDAYLAMELVRGLPLTAFARERGLDLRARVGLLIRVAQAVGAAHQRGVIHRDLKPGNILVSEEGTAAQPKVLDFGLARIARGEGGDGAGASMTEAGSISGTLAYMSPEQARGDPGAVDVRSDVYALGVVLYELVTGGLPYAVDRGDMRASLAVICGVPARRPRDREGGAVARDLETIMLKALEKDPERRYGSADALAEDLARFLGHQPIMARPPTAVYQLAKMVRRHRVGAAGAGLAAALVVGALGVSVWQAARATRSERSAVREAETARATAKFLQDMVASVEYGRHDTTLREALDGASRRLDEGALRDRPEIEVPVRNTIANAYRALAQYEEAERHMRTALATLRARLPADDVHRVSLANDLGLLLKDQKRYEEAAPLFREALEESRRIHAPGSAARLSAFSNYGAVLVDLGRLEEAEPLLAEALGAARGLDPADPEQVAACLNALGKIQQRRGDAAGAEARLRESLGLVREHLGAEHPAVSVLLLNVASAVRDQGRVEDALGLVREAVELRVRLHGPEHPRTLDAQRVLEELERDRGGAAGSPP